MEKRKRQEEADRQLPTILEEETENSAEKQCGGPEFSNSFGNDWDRINISGQRGTNAGGKLLENVELGWGDDFVMDDLSYVVGGGRLGIREEQVQIAKFQGGKERSREDKKPLMALAFMDG